ncbi:protein TALPID3 isoform 2-T2 [Discoglossus pictus]
MQKEHPICTMRTTDSLVASSDGSVSSEGSRVQISVKRLREVPAPFPQFSLKTHDAAYIPPALAVNKYPAVQLTSIGGRADAGQRMSTSMKEPSPPKVSVTKHFEDTTDKRGKVKKTQEGSKCKDIHISQYATGQKEALLAALNKRVQSAPVAKQVRVQLLEDTAAKKNHTSPLDVKQNQVLDSAATVAAATAAAIAAAAPLLQAQSKMESQASSVSQLLDRFHEVDLQLQRLTEQLSKIQSQPAERLYPRDRVNELERQLAQLTEQRLQHLEKLQQQQMEMQSHFINSAIKASTFQPAPTAPVCAHGPTTVSKPLPPSNPTTTAPPSNSEKDEAHRVPDVTSQTGKSPLETPAPRKFVPVPISKDVQVPQKSSFGKENMKEYENSIHLGKGLLLQEILGHDGSSFCRSTNQDSTHFNATKPQSRPYTDSLSLLPTDTAMTRNLSQSTNPPASAAVQKANDVLHDLGQLKREMQDMLQEANQWKTHVNDFKPREQLLSSYLSCVPQKPEPSIRGTVKPQKSMFEDAERILREVQNNKKVLEDNMKAIIRAKDGAAMYSLINALTTNSSTSEKLRIRKDVDSWITEISSEIQDEMEKKDYDRKVQESTLKRNTESARDMKDKKERNIKALRKPASINTKPSTRAKIQQSEETLPGPIHRREGVSQPKKDGRSKDIQCESAMPDEVLDQLYGKPIYQGHRSTLKKGPYLRFSSPSPRSKPQRPKILETVRGIKLKSAKTQTGPTQSKVNLKRQAPHELCVLQEQEPQYVFSPSRGTTDISTPLEGHLIPMAIPLGRSRVDGVSPRPSSVVLTRPQAVTVNVSVSPSPPKPKARTIKPNVAVVEVVSEKKEPPQLTVQVLPCVDIDSIASESTEISERSPSPEEAPPPAPPEAPDIQVPETVETAEEVLAFPGSSYVQVTDIIQDEEEHEIPEPVLELNGWTETAPPQYNGIPFPPPAPAPQTTTDILEGIINRRETLENRLINWVEQEIMARIISEMHPVRRDTIPDISSSSSDDNVTLTSDIVETAGGEGFQLFVDAGVPVDSDLIRKFVDEALAETIAIMLGERESRTPPAPSLRKPDEQFKVEVPPVPTPERTPSTSPLPTEKETSLVKTPELSPQTSIAEPVTEQEQQEDAGTKVSASPVTTPARTPVPSPPRVATPDPHLSEESEDERDTQSQPSPSPWGKTELPLEEENPFPSKEVATYKDACVMTVAKDEELESLVSAASPEPDKLSVSIPPAKSPSPVPSPSSAPSTEESSLTITVTETDTTDRPISEGEVLYSYGQILAARAIAEGGMPLPNITESLSSTLRDANEMEYDPPSEGQVVYGSHRGAHRDPVLSLLAKFNQDPVAPHDVFYHPGMSDEENSVGEISEGQRPRLTIAAEQVLVGHSSIRGQPTHTGKAPGYHSQPLSSPGQYNRLPGQSHGDSDISPGPMSIGELESQPADVHYPENNNYSQTPGPDNSTPQGPVTAQKPQAVPVRLIQVGVKSGDDPHEGTQEDTDRTVVEPSVYLSSPFSGNVSEPHKKMSVTLPSMAEAEHEEDMKAISFESDSSGADVF